jgi:uncharacterized protein YjbI with pentapeptide repeats
MNFFTDAPEWLIIILTIVTFYVLTNFISDNTIISNLIELIEKASLLIGVVLYIKEGPDRRKQFHYQAWSTIDNAVNTKVSQARIMALQDLNKDQVSLRGFKGINIDLTEIKLPNVQWNQCDLSEAILDDSDFSIREFVINYLFYPKHLFSMLFNFTI